MSHVYGVGLNIETNRITTQIKMQLQKKNTLALRQLSLLLHKNDNSGSGVLTLSVFEKSLASFNLFPTKV